MMKTANRIYNGARSPSSPSGRAQSRTTGDHIEAQLKRLTTLIRAMQMENDHLRAENELLMQQLSELDLSSPSMSPPEPDYDTAAENSFYYDLGAAASANSSTEPTVQNGRYDEPSSTAAMFANQRASMRHPVTGRRLATVRLMPRKLHGKTVLGRPQAVYPFKMLDGNIKNEWRKGYDLHLCLKNGTASRVRVIGLPAEGADGGYLVFV